MVVSYHEQVIVQKDPSKSPKLSGQTHNHLVDEDTFEFNKKVQEIKSVSCNAIDQSEKLHGDAPNVHQSTDAEWPILRITSGAIYSVLSPGPK